MLYFGVPSVFYQMFSNTTDPIWSTQAPASLWFAVFYLFGAWFFEVGILLHPSTAARRSWGRKGWWLQVMHHFGFPGFAVHTLFTSCAVPGTAFACLTEFTVLFTSTYWLLKVVDWSDESLQGIRMANVAVTAVFRGALLMFVDVRALIGDRSTVPLSSLLIQCCALLGTNALNIMIVRLVYVAMSKRKGSHKSAWPVFIGLVVRTALSLLGQSACEQLLGEMLLDPTTRSNKFWDDLGSAVQKNLLRHSKGMFGDVGSPGDASPSLPGPLSPVSFDCVSKDRAKPPGGEAEVTCTSLLESVVRIAHDATGLNIDPDAPLLDAGLDSRSALEFHSKMQAEFSSVLFPTTLIFDYPTLRAVVGYIAVGLGISDAVARGKDADAPGLDAPQQTLALTGLACNFPCGASAPVLFQQALALGTDGSIEVPFTRWDLEEYYDANPDAPGKTYAKHAAFVESAEFFDAAFFGVSAPEARKMDPQHRLVLETSYESLLDGGFDRPSLMGSDVAVVVGVSNNDWVQLNSSDVKKLTPYSGTGTSASIAAARVSFTFGLKGPSFIVDTACSSALVALDSAACMLRRSRGDTAVTSAANVMASIGTFVSFSKPRMLSVDGRSFTFDASANGYGRGEGAGGAVLQHVSRVRAGPRAALVGTGINQDGKSSTMTAPNGPSQQQVIKETLREAGAAPADVTHIECHGTGTPLGDPIEVGSLQAVQGQRAESSPLVLAAVKTGTGHLEGSAGSTGLLKTVALLQRKKASPSLHLQTLNPHIADLAEYSMELSSEHLALHPRASGGELLGGVSSFGFGGTNAHAAVSSLAGGPNGEPHQDVAAPGYERRLFPWRDHGYRLLRSIVDAGTFDVPMKSDIYDVVKHHVVFGSIVVPGVVYVEMALEAVRKLFGTGTHLTDVTMVFPFVIPVRTTGLEPTAMMRFTLRGQGRFEIQSISPDGKTTTHVEASLDSSPGPGLDAAHQTPPDLIAIRARVDEPIEPRVVYDAINYVGLWLGPMFQVAGQVWRKTTEERSEVLGRLSLAPSVPNRGYVIHPALFDGTIHILATASIGKSAGGLMIFGGVGRVIVVRQDDFSRLGHYWVHLDIKETCEVSQTFDVQIMSEDGVLLMKMLDVVFRSVKPEQIQMAISAQAVTEDEQKTYEVEWVPDTTQKEDGSEGGGGAATPPWLVIAGTDDVLCGMKERLGDQHEFVSDLTCIRCELSSFGRIIFASGLDTNITAVEVLDSCVRLLQAAILAKGAAPELTLLTRAAVATTLSDMGDSDVPLHAGLWGLARAFRNEHPEIKVRVVDFAAATSMADAAAQLVDSEPLRASLEPELAVRNMADASSPPRQLLAPRLAEASRGADGGNENLVLASAGAYVISGGLGALGLAVAQWLLEKGAGHIALLSRSGVPPKDCHATFKKLSANAALRVWKADVASRSDIEGALLNIGDQMAPVRGIFHAAGVLDDHMVADLQREHLEAVLGAKLDGTLNLHGASAEQPLDIFALFSSIAVAIGSVGQGNYCAANAFLDSFASYRRARQQPALSIQWGPWGGAGMATRAETSEVAIVRLEVPRALAAMEASLAAGAGASVVGVARIRWKTLLGLMPEVPPFLERFNRAAAGGKSAALAAANFSQEDIQSLVVGILKDVMDTEDIDLSTPLMEMGLDSLAGVEFRNRLQASLEGLHLSSTLMFDYPTVPDLVEYIFSEVGPADDSAAEGGIVGTADVGQLLALAGHCGRVPGSSTNDIGEMWLTLRQQLDTTSELPPERWDIDAYYDADVDAPGKTYVKRGHFIPGIEQFDAEFFGVGDAELRGMDPHQWLAVEIAYEGLHAAGHTKETVSGMECGVYIGCATLGGIDLNYPAIGPFTNIGYAYSGLSGRVSHALSLRGPSFTVDTACSSAVVALDSACQAVKVGRCVNAVAAAVNLQLSAAIWIGFSKMRGLAADANCKTFDARADGFARGEGLGALFIQCAGAAGGDGSLVPALLSGVATNHDGRAATITAPNGTAQQRVLRAALGERGTRADDVGCLECHGTGTALGDPIEVGAQRAVYGKGHPVALPLILAAGKSNLGHLEGTAGAAGISKVVLAMQFQAMSPNLWLENLNPNIDLSGYNVLMPSELLQWKTQGAKNSGVSSFGFSGTNGHAILEVAGASAPAPVRRPTQFFKRRLLRPVRDWLRDVLFVEDWIPTPATADARRREKVVVFGTGAISSAVCASLDGAVAAPLQDYSADGISQALRAAQPDVVVFARCADDPGAAVPGEVFQDLLTLLQAAQALPQPLSRFLVITRGALDAKRATFDAGGSLWGLLRSARLEMPRTSVKIVDIPAAATPDAAAHAARSELSGPDADCEVCYGPQGRCVPRLLASPTVAASLQRCDRMTDAGALPTGSDGKPCTHLVTGGLGGLGLLAGQTLAELGAQSLVLASRSGRVQQGSSLDRLFQRLQAFPGLTVHARQCDVSSTSQVGGLVQEVADSVGPIGGVLHAAGVLEKCMLAELDEPSLARVMGPKAAGAWYLHEHNETDAPSLFVLFSSVSSMLGLAGGASYAAANAYLDSLAAWRWQRSGGLSVRFGAVSEIGMTAAAGADARLGDKALSTVSPSQVGSALRLLLASQSLSEPLRPEVMLARADWGTFMRELGVHVPQISDFQAEATAGAGGDQARSAAQAQWAAMSPDSRHAKVLESIRSSAAEMGLTLEDDTPLMEAGIDSLSAVEFRSKVSGEFRQVRMPSTLMFDYPTMTSMAGYIASQLVPADAAAPSQLAMPQVERTRGAGAGTTAIQGLACTLPGGVTSLHSLSALLTAGTDCSIEMPHLRWDVGEYFDPDDSTGLKMYVRHACFIEGGELFDASLFGIGRTEVLAMDPQQRHLLETAYGGFVDAGYQKQGLMGCFGGVFVGQDKSDWNRMLSADHSGPFAATGGSASISSNRVSYALGLRGPSATIDTACSSSLVAADTAAATLRRGRCDVAVVCGVNMLLLPQTFIACCQARMLSPGGRCRTFDASASGYARGEGCGAQVLGSVDPKVQRAELRGSALNQDGRSANLTSPNGPSQEAVVQAALTEAAVPPHLLDVLETHGTGTELGDPIEVGALRSVLGGPARKHPVLLGAVKSNVGHLEGGAGVVGLLKLVAMVERQLALPSLHLRCLNQYIYDDVHEDFEVSFPSEVVARRGKAGMAVSVSSFGFGGTNGHVVVHSNEHGTSGVESRPRAPKRVAFLFTGQGSQHIEMGRQLYEEDRVFRDALDRCAEGLKGLLPHPLLDVIYPERSGGDPKLIDQTRYSQPAIFSLQYALSELWRSRGVQPCAVLGHSVGEYCAAVVAGALSLEEGLRLIAARGRLIQERCEAGTGSMVAVFDSERNVAKAIAKVGAADVSIAAVNGPKMVVVSGSSSTTERVVAELGVTSRPLNVSHAFHSPLMGPALDPFRAECGTAEVVCPSTRFFSTVLGKEAAKEITVTEYWVDHIKNTVQFTSAIEALDKAVQPEAYLEIGASPTLLNMAKRFLKRQAGVNGPAWLPSLDQKKASDTVVVKESETAVGAERPRPVATFNRQPFPWRESAHPLIHRKQTRPDGSTEYSCRIQGHVLELLSHHIVHGEVVVPGACYLEMILAGAAAYMGEREAWCVESLGFAKPLVLRLSDGQLEEPVQLRLLLWPDGRLELESSVGSDPDDCIETTHVEATIRKLPGGWQASRPDPDKFDLEALRRSYDEEVDIDLMYSFGIRCGLPLQRRFRAVRQVQKHGMNGLARLEMERDGTQAGFLLGPSVIDSSFQSLMSLADPEVGIGSLRIPLSVRRLQPTGRPFSIAVWNHFQLLEVTDRSSVFRSYLLNDAGEVLLHFDHVHLQEVREEHIQRVLAASGRGDVEQQAVYTTHWPALPELATDPAAPTHDAGARCLVLGDTKDAHSMLAAGGGDAAFVFKAQGVDVDIFDEESVLRALGAQRWSSVVFAFGLLDDAGDVHVLALALHLVRAMVRLGAKAAAAREAAPPPLWLLTRGSQPLASNDGSVRAAGSSTHAGLWGFARTVRLEYPDSICIRCLDLDALVAASGQPPKPQQALAGALGLLANAPDEVEVATRESGFVVSRLARSSATVRGPIRLNMPTRGALTNLRPVPQVRRRPVEPQFVQLRVRAVGLNFRDVLNVMGLYPGDPGPPGADCAGTVIDLGEKVEHLRVAEDVFGEAPGCLSTCHVAPAPLLTQKPGSWSFEEASTMPVVFVTVEESLGDLAKLKKGERVLIHAAAGGVGLVAIQYAQFVGAEVYATAGAQVKHDFLRSLGVKRITSSRKGQTFEDDMRAFLKEDGADGVDVVLNSLSHDDYIPRSLGLLRHGGRFMEIGKRGVWSVDQVKERRPDVMYQLIAADTMMEQEPWRYNGYLKRLCGRVDAGGLKPINIHLFNGFEEGVAALQFLQRAQNIGKVVVSEPSRMLCQASPEGAALLSGGMGSLGLVTARYLLEEGSKSVCLLSRSGKPPADGLATWDWLKSSAAEVTSARCDVSSSDAVLALKEATGKPFSALFHLAGVLRDGMIDKLDADSFRGAYAPKVHGLHSLCELPFEDGAPFVLFSSTSSLFGSLGQANYAAANSVLDSLAPRWAAQGARRARAIQWGPWAEVGMAVNDAGTLQRAKAGGVGALGSSQGAAIMGSVLSGEELVVGAVHVKWATFLRVAYDEPPLFLEALQAESRRAAPDEADGDSSFMATLAAMPADERLAAVRTAIHTMAQEVVDDSDLTADAPLLESGMDSLSGVEFRNRLLKEFAGVRLPNSAVFDHPSVDALARFVDGQLGDAAAPGTADAAPPAAITASGDAAARRSSGEHAPFVERLNQRSAGVPILLLPGAGMQAASLRPLASLLPVPAFGFSWPMDGKPRTEWPSSLEELALLVLQEFRAAGAGDGAFAIAGHSFGGAVALEVARCAEAAGCTVPLVVLLDARHVPPVASHVADAFNGAGLADTLAILAQSGAESHAELLDELAGIDDREAREDALQSKLNPAMLEPLKHMAETNQWYAGLLCAGAASGEAQAPETPLSARLLLLQAAETWKEHTPEELGKAEAAARRFQAAVFQSDEEVREHLGAWAGTIPAQVAAAPGGHFGFLREPYALAAALRVCAALVEVGAEPI